MAAIDAVNCGEHAFRPAWTLLRKLVQADKPGDSRPPQRRDIVVEPTPRAGMQSTPRRPLAKNTFVTKKVSPGPGKRKRDHGTFAAIPIHSIVYVEWATQDPLASLRRQLHRCGQK